SRRFSRSNCICCPSQGLPGSIPRWRGSSLAAMRDFGLVDDRLGSIATDRHDRDARPMSASPPILSVFNSANTVDECRRYADRCKKPTAYACGGAMNLPRRKFLHLAAGIAAVPATARIARAQAYPTGPVRLIVGFPAGGTNDVHARLIAEWLSKQFGRSFVVENRPGATGNIALEAVVRAAPDGYMLSVCGSTELRNEIIYTDLKFSFMRDTTPVASIYRAPLVVVVHPSFSARSVPELIAAAKAMPD